MNTDDTNGTQQAPETALAKYRDEGFNIIAADDKIHTTSPAHRVDYAIIQVHPDPGKGEVYKVGSVPVGSGKYEDRYALSASVLNRIALAASIVWNPDKTGPDRNTLSRNYLLYEAVGYMTTPAGETITLKGSKEIDLEVLEFEIREEHAVKIYNGDQKIKSRRNWDRTVTYDDLTLDQQKRCDRATLKEMIQIRKNRFSLGETKAKNRAIRSIGLKSSYSAEELSKPFVIPRIVRDMAHPMNVGRLKEISEAVYGPPPVASQPDPAMAVEPGQEHQAAETRAERPPGEASQDDRASPPDEAPGGEGGPTFVNEEGAEKLKRFAGQFGIDEQELIQHVGSQYGCEKLTELTTAQFKEVRLWVQERTPISAGHA